MKTEPLTFGIDHLKEQKISHWEGVRNYQARNNMRAMKKGDLAFIYHSSCDLIGIAGLGRVEKEAYPDHFAWDTKSKYFDPKSTPQKPVWFMVDIAFESKFKKIIPLSELRNYPELEGMPLLRTGLRLSVQPVSEKQFQFIKKVAS